MTESQARALSDLLDRRPELQGIQFAGVWALGVMAA